MNTLRQAVEHRNLRMRVAAIAHKKTDIITPKSGNKTSYFQLLLVDKRDVLVVTAFLNNARNPIDFIVGTPYEIDLITSDKYGSITGKVFTANAVNNEALLKWYKEEYVKWLDRAQSVLKMSALNNNPDIPSVDRVNFSGTIRLVGNEILCENGAIQNSYSITDNTGTTSVTIYGRNQLSVGEVIFLRNVKVKSGKFTVDDLSDVFLNNSCEEVELRRSEGTMSQSFSQSFVSFADNLSPVKKRMRIAFQDSDSFYVDLREDYKERPKHIDLKQCLKILLDNAADHIEIGPLVDCVLEALDLMCHPKGIEFLTRILGTVKSRAPDTEIEEDNEGKFSLIESSVHCILRKYLNNVDKRELLEIFRSMGTPSIDSVFTLIRCALKNMAGANSRQLKKKLLRFLKLRTNDETKFYIQFICYFFFSVLSLLITKYLSLRS